MRTPPNVVIFFTDQQRWDTLGLHGNPMGLTPNLDRLARQGTFFQQAVTCQPVCGPARSCLQTGQYATTTGVWCNGPGLKPDAVTLANCFHHAGYRTGYIGKWHLAGPDAPKGPVAPEQRGGYRDWLAANLVELVSGPYSTVLWDGDGNPRELPGYRVDAMTDAAIRYVDERAREPDRPYLLCLSLLEPHHQNTDDSYPAPPGYAEAFQGRWLPPDLQALGGSSARHWAGYCGMVKRIDEALGRLMDAFRSTGQLDHTIVAFVSDHGCHFKTRNSEYKRSPHEASVRIPLALWGPGFDGGGTRTEAASLVDVPATLLDAAGIPAPDSLQGRSLLPLTRNDNRDWPEDTYIQFGDGFLPPGRAIRTRRWKYCLVGPETSVPDALLYAETELYDLRTDPYELENLIDSRAHQPIRDRLRDRLLIRMRQIEGFQADITPVDPGTRMQRTIDYPHGDP